MTKLWIRAGDVDEYNDMGSEKDHIDTLDNAGLYLANSGAIPPLSPSADLGVIDQGEFSGRNYISIFWGDAEAEPIRELTIGELAEINVNLKHYSGL